MRARAQVRRHFSRWIRRGAATALADHDSLADRLAALRRGQALPPGRKLLLVLDQFEQWLFAHRSERGAGLLEALRQCDGERVQ